MREVIRKELEQMAEEKYRKFSSSLIPGEDTMLGVRLPQLRKMAKKIAADNWQTELKSRDVYFEEVLLRGMIISYGTQSMTVREALSFIEDFIPRVKNWSVCDSVFSKMTVLQKDRSLTWEFIQPYLKSGEEFQVRVALVIMMQHLLKSDKQGQYLEKILAALSRPFEEGYYAHMAAAWLIAEAYCSFPAATEAFLADPNCGLDRATYNKALQKIIESRIPSQEAKEHIRNLKK